MEEVEAVLTNIEDRDNAIYRLYFEAIQSLKNNANKVLVGLTATKNMMGSITRK